MFVEKQSGNVKSIMTVDEMREYAKRNPAVSNVYVTDAVNELLFRFLAKVGKATPDLHELIIDPDIFRSGSIRIPDCQLNWLWKNETESFMDEYRIVLFPEYKDIVSHAGGNDTIIGFIQFQKLLVPFGIATDRPELIYGDLFYGTGKHRSFTDPCFNRSPNFRDQFICAATIWYAIQVAAIDPQTRSLFDDPVIGPDPYAPGGMTEIYALDSKSAQGKLRSVLCEPDGL